MGKFYIGCFTVPQVGNQLGLLPLTILLPMLTMFIAVKREPMMPYSAMLGVLSLVSTSDAVL